MLSNQNLSISAFLRGRSLASSLSQGLRHVSQPDHALSKEILGSLYHVLYGITNSPQIDTPLRTSQSAYDLSVGLAFI